MRFGTAETLVFVRSWLAHPLRVLEVGCGEGELAAALVEGGYRVVAIDSDAAAVEIAKARGVDARLATWPLFDDGQFDAVLFTRSLHHIEPLDAAVAHAREVLQPGGRIIIEDFAPAEMSPRFLSWLREELSRIGQQWQQDPVHPISEIQRAVASRFEIVHDTSVPYCYRYFADHDAARMYDAELELGERPLGRRIVAAIH